jgi:hypothetical protein
VVYNRRDERFNLVKTSTSAVHGTLSGNPPPSVGGSGTANYIPIWTSGSDIGDSNIYQVTVGSYSGDIVIGGPTSTQFNLQVVGSSTGLGGGVQLRASNTSTATASLAYVGADADNAAVVSVLGADGLGTGPMGTPSAFFGSYTNHPTGIITDNVERMRVTTAGYVGIATTTPATPLEVNGTAAFDTSVGIGTISPATPLEVNGTAAFDTNLGIGTTSPTANLEVNGTAKFDGAVTFGSAVNGALGNPPTPSGTQGVVFHVDGVKYASIDSVFTTPSNLPNNSVVTIYDDCPGGAEMLNNDPFNPSNGNTYFVHIISAPCVYAVEVPIHMNAGDTWWGAGPGGYQLGGATPTYTGTTWQMGRSFPAPVTSSPNAPTGASFTAGSSTGFTPGNYYWVGVTAIDTVGETPLVNGNNNQLSYKETGAYSSGLLTVNLGSSLPTGATALCLYIIDGGSMPTFPSNLDPVGQQFTSGAPACFTSAGAHTLNLFTAKGNNPPPDANTTGSLITMGPASNMLALTNTGVWFGNGVIDCNGGATSIGITNNSAQDPASGMSNLQSLNCRGDASIEVLGYDGHAGGNGSSILNVFQFDSNCQTSSSGCTGGLLTGNYTSISFPKYPVHLNNVGNMKTVQNIDIGADSCPALPTGCGLAAGLRLDQAPNQNSLTKVQVFAVHCEANLLGSGDAYLYCVDDNGVPATIDGVHTDDHITKAVYLRDTTGVPTASVSVRDIVPYPNSSHYAIQDDVNSYTSPGGLAIGSYDIEQAGNFFNAAGPGGPTLGGGLSVLFSNLTASAISAGAAVCVDTTTGHANAIVPCQTSAATPFIGVTGASIQNSATGAVIITGLAFGLTIDGSCAVGDYAIAPASTAGHISCSATATAGAELGVVMNTSPVSVLIAPR